ncbi:hypothetical protein [Haloarcula rubripromontorii]|uniref:hypothetical protein n=1 Tax=Haloarcula rubripromontorii TaxID=1705562 RepID=UPI00345BA3B0
MSSKHPSTSTDARRDPPKVHHWTHDYEVVHVDDDAREIADLLTDARAASYVDGPTREVVYDDAHTDAADTFRAGTRAEVATALHLDREPMEAVDLNVSDWGDDGSDLTLRETSKEVDVKAHESLPVGDPPRLLVKREKVEKAAADVYVLAQEWGSEWVVVHGWCTRRDLVRNGRVEKERWNSINWELPAEELRPAVSLRDWDNSTPF